MRAKGDVGRFTWRRRCGEGNKSEWWERIEEGAGCSRKDKSRRNSPSNERRRWRRFSARGKEDDGTRCSYGGRLELIEGEGALEA